MTPKPTHTPEEKKEPCYLCYWDEGHNKDCQEFGDWASAEIERLATAYRVAAAERDKLRAKFYQELGDCDECGTEYSYDPTDGGSICVKCAVDRLNRAESRLAEVEAEKALLGSKIEELSRNSQCWVPDRLFRETETRLARASEIIKKKDEALGSELEQWREFKTCANSEDYKLGEEHSDSYGCEDGLCYMIGGNIEAKIESLFAALALRLEGAGGRD